MDQYQRWNFQFEQWMGGDVVQSQDGAAISAQGLTSAATTTSGQISTSPSDLVCSGVEEVIIFCLPVALCGSV